MDRSAGIQGTVVTASGEPLGKATVTLTRMQFPQRLIYSSTTDASGRFRLEGLEAGQYQLAVDRNGYVVDVGGVPSWSFGGRRYRLDAGTVLDDVLVRMVRQAVVAGRLMDADEEPISNAAVELLGSAMSTNLRANTNDLGEYRLAGIVPGWYVLRADAGGGSFRLDSTIQRGPQEVFPLFYFPGSTDESDAVALKLNSGDELRGLDLKVPKARAFRVRGRVMLPEGTEPRSLHIHLGRRHHATLGILDAPSSPCVDGQFEFGGILPGVHDLTVLCSTVRPHSARMTVEVIDRDLEGLVVTFPSGASVEGRVQPVEPTDRFRPGSVVVALSRIEGETHSGGRPADSNGAFRIFDLVPGRYRVVVHVIREDGYAASVKYGEGK